jgi:isopenicillin N synthase-like dioxygenase
MDDAKYPVETPGLKAAADDFKTSLGQFAKKLFRAFAVYLKLDDPDYFIKKHTALDNPKEVLSHTTFRSTYYMALDSDADIGPGSMRLGEHNDWGTITFLYQDMAGGLEALPPNDVDWIEVTPIPNSLVLNAGLMLEMWSGGHFPATVI